MNQDFILEIDYFYDKNKLLELLGIIANGHNHTILNTFEIYINNIPTSLEFYVYLSYNVNKKEEIEYMKELLFPISI